MAYPSQIRTLQACLLLTRILKKIIIILQIIKLNIISEWLTKHKKKKPSDAKDAWKASDKKEKKKWHEKLEPQRQKYIEDYTVFVRGLDKEELEMYTELKQKRDEEEENQNDSSDSETDSSESDESDSDSESDSDI